MRVDAMLEMFDNLGTSGNEKVKLAFPEAGTHVIACELFSKSYTDVYAKTVKFAEQVLKLEKEK